MLMVSLRRVSISLLFLSLSGSAELKDFHPIILVSGIYKIISKVLANRLRLVMNNIISTTQIAFVKGKQILDLVFIAN